MLVLLEGGREVNRRTRPRRKPSDQDKSQQQTQRHRDWLNVVAPSLLYTNIVIQKC